MKVYEIKELAREAGFEFWKGEEHAPVGSELMIDWASDYDQEMIEFVRLIENKTKLKFGINDQ